MKYIFFISLFILTSCLNVSDGENKKGINISADAKKMEEAKHYTVVFENFDNNEIHVGEHLIHQEIIIKDQDGVVNSDLYQRSDFYCRGSKINNIHRTSTHIALFPVKFYMHPGPLECELKIDTNIEVKNNKINFIIKKPYLNPNLDDEKKDELVLRDSIIDDFTFPSIEYEYSYQPVIQSTKILIEFDTSPKELKYYDAKYFNLKITYPKNTQILRLSANDLSFIENFICSKDSKNCDNIDNSVDKSWVLELKRPNTKREYTNREYDGKIFYNNRSLLYKNKIHPDYGGLSKIKFANIFSAGLICLRKAQERDYSKEEVVIFGLAHETKIITRILKRLVINLFKLSIIKYKDHTLCSLINDKNVSINYFLHKDDGVFYPKKIGVQFQGYDITFNGKLLKN